MIFSRLSQNKALGSATALGPAAEASGGGISARGIRSLVIGDNSVIEGNVARIDGGGIAADFLDIIDSTVERNFAITGKGGGIVVGVGGFATVTSSTFTGNIAALSGGGIGDRAAEKLSVSDQSMIIGNFALDEQGGGIGLNTATLDISHSTVDSNFAPVCPNIAAPDTPDICR